MNIKKTALYELHKKHNAKFVEFAGYSMPIQYSEGIVKEHNITRNKSGIFDVSHMGQLFIKYSNDITDKLQEILPTDLKNLKINQSKYSFLMKENGGIYDDLIITRMKDQYMIILNAACKQNDLQIIKNKLNDQNLDMNNNLSLVAIQGPESKTILENVVSNVSKLKFMNGENFSFKNNEIFITRSGYTGEDGFEISVQNKNVLQLVEILFKKSELLPIGLGARDSLRLEAGLCLYGNDLTSDITPVEANLNWVIHKRRRNQSSSNIKFLGNTEILNQLEKGPFYLRIGLLPVEKAPMRTGSIIYLDNEGETEIGIVTSGGFSPTLNKPISMGRIQSEYLEDLERVYVKVRDKILPAIITKLPFIKTKYKI